MTALSDYSAYLTSLVNGVLTDPTDPNKGYDVEPGTLAAHDADDLIAAATLDGVPVIRLEDAKRHMNIIHDADDTLLRFKIAAAQSTLRAYIGPHLDANDNAVSYFDDPATCPHGLKEATRKLAAELYEQREHSIAGQNIMTVPIGIAELAAPFRHWTF